MTAPVLRRLVMVCGAVALAMPAPRTLGAQAVPLAAVLLRHGVRVDSAEVATLEAGESVVRVLPTHDSRDIAVIGAVRLGVTRDLYLRRVHDFRTWLRTPTRTKLGIFSDPAAPVTSRRCR